MARRIKSFSEGPYPAQLSLAAPKKPLDVQHQYSELKRFLKAEKQKQQLEYQQNLPFKFLYYGLAGIFIAVLIIGAYETTTASQDVERRIEKESEECLMRFHSNNCQLVNPSEDCSRLLVCMKNKGERIGNLEYLFYSLRNAFSLISDKIMGPIMLGIFGILVKLIQVMIKNQLERSLPE